MSEKKDKKRKVKDIMIEREQIETIKEDTFFSDIEKLIKGSKTKCLPIVNEDDSLIGIVTEIDYAFAHPSKETTLSIYELTYVIQKLRARDMANKNPITISSDRSLLAAAKLMIDNNIGCLPVVEEGKFVGLIAWKQIFQILLDEERNT